MQGLSASAYSMPEAYPKPALTAAQISKKISETVLCLPTDISNIIGDYACNDYSLALEALKKYEVDVPATELVLCSPECDPQIKMDLIAMFISQSKGERLRTIIKNLIHHGKNIYLNNITLGSKFSMSADWMSTEEELLSVMAKPPEELGKFIFSGSTLNGLRANGLSFPRADFSSSTINFCSFKGACLTGADFSNSLIRSTSFDEQTYGFSSGCSFKFGESVPTGLKFARFIGADIEDSSFDGAFMDRSNFTGAKGVEKIKFNQTNIPRIIFFDRDSAAISKHPVESSKWLRTYIKIYDEMPTQAQLADLTQKLAFYSVDDLISAGLSLRLAGPAAVVELLKFSEQPGGDNPQRNIFLFNEGIRACELRSYNQFRSQGLDRQQAISKVKAARK